MNRRILLSLLIISGLAGFANNRNVRTTTVENYVTAGQGIQDVYIALPDMRDVKSGSKLVVKYEGDWPAGMMGAFDYAVRIWEEVLPEALPINVTARIESIDDPELLSRVAFDTFDFTGEDVSNYAASMPMVKSVLLQEYHRSGIHRFANEITDLSDLACEDITIVYNKNLVGQLSFSLDGTDDATKYDFVTMALRDIAIGLGYTTSFKVDAEKEKFEFTGSRLTPFETLVMNAIGSSDPATAYANATKGSLSVPLNTGEDMQPEALDLYAPEQWNDKSSLRFLIAEDSNPLALLLRHDFGKGYTMHDLTQTDWNGLFGAALGWRCLTADGSPSGNVSLAGTTDDVIPYRGAVTLGFDTQRNSGFQPAKEVRQGASADAPDGDGLTGVTGYCRQFNHFSPDGPVNHGISLSVLKKDGTWDCVYSTKSIHPVTVNIEDLPLHCDESEYARSVNGGLRYRITQCNMWLHMSPFYNFFGKYITDILMPAKPEVRSAGKYKYVSRGNDRFHPFGYNIGDFSDEYFVSAIDRDLISQQYVINYDPTLKINKNLYYDYKVKYFTRDFTPEKPVIKYMSTEDSPLQTFSLMDDEDDYYVDVKVGIANVEGVIGVVVEQWDEGEELPFQYDAEDFRNGYFIANLDRELSTRLTVASYNANGFKRSETITIPPIGYPTREVTFKRNNDVITLGGISGRLRESGRLSCRVNSVMGSASYATTLPVEDGKVDVSAIPQGVYVLTVLNGSDKIGTYKFLK